MWNFLWKQQPHHCLSCCSPDPSEAEMTDWLCQSADVADLMPRAPESFWKKYMKSIDYRCSVAGVADPGWKWLISFQNVVCSFPEVEVLPASNDMVQPPVGGEAEKWTEPPPGSQA
eukprot:EG_transcript_54028